MIQRSQSGAQTCLEAGKSTHFALLSFHWLCSGYYRTEMSSLFTGQIIRPHLAVQLAANEVKSSNTGSRFVTVFPDHTLFSRLSHLCFPSDTHTHTDQRLVCRCRRMCIKSAKQTNLGLFLICESMYKTITIAKSKENQSSGSIFAYSAFSFMLASLLLVVLEQRCLNYFSFCTREDQHPQMTPGRGGKHFYFHYWRFLLLLESNPASTRNRSRRGRACHI